MRRSSAVAALGAVTVLAVVNQATAATGDPLLVGKRTLADGPTKLVGNNDSFAFSARNLGTGGAGAFTCKSELPGVPCLRSLNTSTAPAFWFETRGDLGGRIKV